MWQGIVILVLLSHATAATAQHVTLIGAGTNATCGTWADGRKTTRGWYDMGNWAFGFLSGAAVYSSILDPLNGMDADGVADWLDNYCKAHAVEPFAAALKAFVSAHPN